MKIKKRYVGCPTPDVGHLVLARQAVVVAVQIGDELAASGCGGHMGREALGEPAAEGAHPRPCGISRGERTLLLTPSETARRAL